MVIVTYDTPQGKAVLAKFDTMDEAITAVFMNPPKVDGHFTNVYLAEEDEVAEGIDWIDDDTQYEPIPGGMTTEQIEEHERAALRY